MNAWSAADLGTYANLLRLEHNSIVPPTRESLWEFMRVADTIGRAFNGIRNADVKQTVERVFNDLVDTPTSHRVKVPAVFLGSAFGRWGVEKHEPLVYAAAMALIDPDGDYMLSHDPLKALLQSLHDLPRTNDPATAALVQALRHHINVLDADPAYPLTDPYSSETFPVRKADTLAALNAAWKGLRT